MLGSGLTTDRALIIGAIAYNEAPYLLEWIAYHRHQGAAHFYVGDNESSDATSSMLEILQNEGIVTRLFVPRRVSGNAQIEAYTEILRRLAGVNCNLAFLDLDEFLVPDDPELRAARLIAELMAPSDVGALGLNWRIFGSSGCFVARRGLVLERFEECARSDARIHHHIKTVTKPKAAFEATAHRVRLRAGYRYIDAAGENYPFDSTRGFAPEHRILHAPLCVHHYVIKSYQEFIYKKMMRGRATQGSGASRNLDYFHKHDLNEAQSRTAMVHVEAVKEGVRGLNARIGAVAARYPKAYIGEIRVGSAGTSVEIVAKDGVPSGQLVLVDHGQEPHRELCFALPLIRPDKAQQLRGLDGACRQWIDLPFRFDGETMTLRLTPQLPVVPDLPEDFLNLGPSAAAQPHYTGRVTELSENRVSGWARDFVAAAPVTVELLLGKMVVATTVASEPRTLARERGLHPTGACGFSFVRSSLTVKSLAGARCRVLGDTRLLAHKLDPEFR